MIIFWAAAISLTVFVVAVLVRTAFSAPRSEPEAAKDIEIYKAQLREVERDVERGVVSAADAEALRTEIARRLLAADAAAQGQEARAKGGTPPVATLLAALTVAGITLGTYLAIGAPGYGDMPLAARLESYEMRAETSRSQAEAQAAYLASRPPAAEPAPRDAALMAQMRAVMAERPDDTRGLAILARNEAALGNYAAAITAQEQLIAVLDAAAGAPHYRDLAEIMILAAGGYVSPEAEAALRRALTADPTDGSARYYLGLMHSQFGRVDRTFALWAPLLEESPANAPWVPFIRQQLPTIAELAGVRYVLPEGRGPSEADIAAAAEMSAEDRADMIAGMVEGLAQRLATQGGPPEDWARLIAAQAVLGNQETAQAILEEARLVFADRADALNLFQRTAIEQDLR
ncbi:MAG: c-type cytochrome biogenesis protein CcmI [Pseudomonadota bacterium]